MSYNKRKKAGFPQVNRLSFLTILKNFTPLKCKNDHTFKIIEYQRPGISFVILDLIRSDTDMRSTLMGVGVKAKMRCHRT